MPMREDCKFFESRSYPSGDTVRKCDLDLAPEAPWRCPENCNAYQRRLADVNWKYGSLVTPPAPDEPDSLGDDESIAALLDSAEEIVRAAGPSVVADLEAERRSRRSSSSARRKPRLGKGGGSKPTSGRGQRRSTSKPSASGDEGLRDKLGRFGQYLRDQRNKDT